MPDPLFSLLGPTCPWRDRVHYLDRTDSTNTYLKSLARQGAPEGTVVIAGCQTGGRGRMGRSFCSQQGMGVYMSVLLRPDCEPEAFMHLTCAVGVAMCRAVNAVAGFAPELKWINDLVWDGRKLGGILTELSISPSPSRVDWAVVGIGINCLQTPSDFPPELQALATSLAMITGKVVPPSVLAAAMIRELADLNPTLLTHRQSLMDAYRSRCITIGKEVRILRPDRIEDGWAESVDDRGALLVRMPDGQLRTVSSGEVSIRGKCGYL